VSFAPANAGAHVGVLTVRANGGGTPQTVILNGTGTEPTSQSTSSATIVLSSSVANLEVSTTGQSTKSLLTITPKDGFAGIVNLKCEVISDTPAVQTALPTCSLSATQVNITNNTVGESTLLISMPSSNMAATSHRTAHYKGISLAGLSLLGLLPFSWLRRKSYLVYVSLMLLFAMIGCGDTPTSSANSYKVVITATSGATANASIGLPLTVQVQ
jgi:hypothetical protein